MHNAICYNKRATCDKGELLTEPPSLLHELLTEPLRLLLECICVEVNKQTTVCFITTIIISISPYPPRKENVAELELEEDAPKIPHV